MTKKEDFGSLRMINFDNAFGIMKTWLNYAVKLYA
jgi:hypothetical protein